MGGSGGGGSSSQTTTVRYAPYIESMHSNFLSTVAAHRNAVINLSPFTSYTEIEIDDAFFGAGYTISSFPSLYDMYGKFMAGLDIEALWTQVYTDTLESTVVNSLIAAENALLDDEIEEVSLPRLQSGMRDINSILSSNYSVSKAIIEDTKTKQMNKFSAELKYNLIPIAQRRWEAHLDWNKLVVATYAEIMKLYFSAKIDVDDVNYAMIAKDRLWPFTVLEFERAALGALQGATTSKADVAGASTASRVISGAMTGAAMGAMLGGQITNTAATQAAKAAGTLAAGQTVSYASMGAGVGTILGAAAAFTY